MNASLQLQDQTKRTKTFAFLILIVALTATADHIVRVMGSGGEWWYRCESECLIIPIGNNGHAVIGVEGEAYEIDGPPGSNNNGSGGSSSGNSDSGSGSSGGGGGEGSGTGSDSGGGYYPFIPSSGGPGTACPGGVTMQCDADSCVINCHQN